MEADTALSAQASMVAISAIMLLPLLAGPVTFRNSYQSQRFAKTINSAARIMLLFSALPLVARSSYYQKIDA